MKTYMPKAADQAKREWFVVDGTGLTVGRLATKLAKVLMGKHKPTFTQHLDMGDFVVVVNADKLKLTGTKARQKTYEYWTGWRSGYKSTRVADLIDRDPGRILRLAVQRMLPKNCVGRAQITKLKTYTGASHPHAAQKPKALDLARI